jgi:branched-chain amino acid transport system ATP-binding protein
LTDTVILEAIGLSKSFGGLVALQDYNLRMCAGDLTGLIGPNGAGKTTAFNLLTGVSKPTHGRILIGGRDLAGQPAHVFARRGIARTFQNIRLFKEMSILENVMTGFHVRHGASLLETLIGLPGFWNSERAIAERAIDILAMLGLSSPHNRAGDLPYGQQRLVEIARAVASEPRLLLLDEPAAGMNAKETDELVSLITRINRDLGIAVLVVEHDMRFVMNLCDHVQVLNRGEMLAEGSVDEVRKNPAVVEAYLGTRRALAHA